MKESLIPNFNSGVMFKEDKDPKHSIKVNRADIIAALYFKLQEDSGWLF